MQGLWRYGMKKLISIFLYIVFSQLGMAYEPSFDKETQLKTLTKEQYQVTQDGKTEPAFSNSY